MNQSENIGELATALHKNDSIRNLSGKRFAGWLVLYQGPSSSGKIRYFCRCDCGNECLVDAGNLKKGRSKHCLKCSRSYRHTYHGMSKSKTYAVYTQMIERCHNPSHKYYYLYGNRGIFVCDKWKESFKYFIEDMGLAPESLSIDRLDNYKGYYKENCRWATREQQDRNKRNSIFIGEVSNDWKVMHRFYGEKAYTIKCLNCSKEIKILSCNFRRKNKCQCEQES